MAATAAVPTLSAADLAAIQANIGRGAEGITAINTNPGASGQGVGTSYMGLLPTYMQDATNGLLANVQPGDDPVLDYFVSHGYLQQQMSGGGDSAYNTYVPGPNAPKQLGTQGYGTNNVVQLDNANPFGTTVQGALDVHNVNSPTQAPQAFGHDAYGPIEAAANLTPNQDAWSKYIIPLMQVAASFAMPAAIGAVGGAGAGLGNIGRGLFSTGGNAITSDTGPTVGNVVPGAGMSLARLLFPTGL